MHNKQYYVYILSNKSHVVLYTGVTNDLAKRVYQHKHKEMPGFTSQYNVDHLVYYEQFDNPIDAINREKQIKAGSRKRKKELVEKMNPKWYDLSDGWY